MAERKTIEAILEQGDPDGVFKLTESEWKGILYSSSREFVVKLFATIKSRYGIYLLLSENQVYVGQTTNLEKRTKDHLHDEMDWWTRIIVLTTEDDHLTRSDIDYLEYELIQKAGNRFYRKENKKKGNPQKVVESQKIKLNNYLREVYIVLKFLGVYVFSEKKESIQTSIQGFDSKEAAISGTKNSVEPAVKIYSEGVVTNRSGAKNYLDRNGIVLGKFHYASWSDKNHVYWFNPKITILENDCTLVLNNKENHELILLIIPAKTLTVEGHGDNVLKVRHDRPDILDLNITKDLVDRGSGVDFKRFEVRKFIY